MLLMSKAVRQFQIRRSAPNMAPRKRISSIIDTDNAATTAPPTFLPRTLDERSWLRILPWDRRTIRARQAREPNPRANPAAQFFTWPIGFTSPSSFHEVAPKLLSNGQIPIKARKIKERLIYRWKPADKRCDVGATFWRRK